MKKLFSTLIAFSFAVTGLTAAAENASPDASPEAKPAETTITVPAEAVPVTTTAGKVEVPELIAEHLAVRFPGYDVKGITREGVTYVVDLGDGLHIRYDNCFNPVCYGVHNHEH